MMDPDLEPSAKPWSLPRLRRHAEKEAKETPYAPRPHDWIVVIQILYRLLEPLRRIDPIFEKEWGTVLGGHFHVIADHPVKRDYITLWDCHTALRCLVYLMERHNESLNDQLWAPVKAVLDARLQAKKWPELGHEILLHLREQRERLTDPDACPRCAHREGKEHCWGAEQLG
jgi:hypothetical protein